MAKCAIFIALYVVMCSVQADNVPIVNTAIGTIRGVKSDDGQYDMYMGIPYARVNDSNPFGAPLPYPDFDGIFDANDDSSMCPQIEEFNNTIVGDLDCLRLNIYTPTNVKSNSRLPVFIWIYGGMFTIGFYGRYMHGPKYLVRHDVIVVTINYRIGAYGFMCLDIPEVPGNAGFKDQVRALRWLRSHISAFGGDPDRMTVAGNSAGGMSIDFHLLRDNSEDKLFQRAIIQSGTSFVISQSEKMLDAPIVLAKQLGLETNNINEAIGFLSGLNPKDILEAQNILGISISGPCIEKTFPDVESYLSRNWLTAPAHGVNNMTVLIGINDDEAGAMRMLPPLPLFITYFLSSKFDNEHDDFRGMSELVDQFVLGERNLFDIADDLFDFVADMQFVYPTYRTIYKYLENNAGNIYLYNFSYVGNRNVIRQRSNATIGGAYHADEVGYLFDMEFLSDESEEDQLMVDKMTTLWTNFAKYGDPTPEQTDLLDMKWDAIVPGSPMYSMNIDKQLDLVANPIVERATFWDLFYEKNGHLERVLRMT